MMAGFVEKSVEWFRLLVFEKISKAIKPGAVKGLMDPAFAIVEKFAYEFSVFTERYLSIYKPIIDGELSLLDSIEMKKVLVIGSGSLPATAILFARFSDASVLGIDIDEKAVFRANRLVERMGFSQSKLKFVQGDGLCVDLSGFDVVLLLYGIRSQMKMLECASTGLDDDAVVLVRAVCENSLVRIDSECVDLSKWFDVIGQVHSTALGPIDSFLLKKKSSGLEGEL